MTRPAVVVGALGLLGVLLFGGAVGAAYLEARLGLEIAARSIAFNHGMPGVDALEEFLAKTRALDLADALQGPLFTGAFLSVIALLLVLSIRRFPFSGLRADGATDAAAAPPESGAPGEASGPISGSAARNS